MRHPAVLALAAGAIVLLVAMALPLWHMGRDAEVAAQREHGLPWQVAVLDDGSTEVMGLHPGRDTLGDAILRLGDALQPALVARVGEVGVLEALADPFAAGFVSGRLVLAFDVPPEVLRRWRESAGSSEAMEGGLRRFALRADQLDEARAMRMVGLSYVPALTLAEADVRQRFGPPRELRRQPGDVQVLLYPDRGLAATVKPGSRAVLQYVAPREFEARLRAPLGAP